jgi:Mrp family chromosome partitioning ATPase
MLRGHYDVILIDTPPLLPVTDAAAVSPATDGAILITRYKRTTRGQLESAMTALGSVGANVLGTVLTMVPNSGVHAYAHYRSYYQPESRPTPSPGPRTNGVPRAYLHSGTSPRNRGE